jgi:hypothetical protein
MGAKFTRRNSFRLLVVGFREESTSYVKQHTRRGSELHIPLQQIYEDMPGRILAELTSRWDN